MSELKTSYHHGALRESLLRAAAQLLEAEGVEGLSMRKLAEMVGVSRSAPYHHFRDKHELLCAIAESGFREQDALLEGLMQNQGRAGVQRFVRRYVDFATTQREQYDLMYGREIWKMRRPTPTLEQAARQSFKRWVADIESLQRESILPKGLQAVRLAQVSWATLHGLCRLVNDGIYLNRADLSEMEDTLVIMLTGPESA